jgi:hypothetical protein
VTSDFKHCIELSVTIKKQSFLASGTTIASENHFAAEFLTKNVYENDVRKHRFLNFVGRVSCTLT